MNKIEERSWRCCKTFKSFALKSVSGTCNKNRVCSIKRPDVFLYMIQDCGYDREIPVKVRVIIGVTSLEVKEAPLNPDSGNLNGLILFCSLLRPHRVKETKLTASYVAHFWGSEIYLKPKSFEESALPVNSLRLVQPVGL